MAGRKRKHEETGEGESATGEEGDGGGGGEGEEGGVSSQADVTAPQSQLSANDMLCPICMETFKEVHVTLCGHSFCYACITHTLTQMQQCPVCKTHLPLQNPIHPNFSLNDLVAKNRLRQQAVCSGPARDSPKMEELLQVFLRSDVTPAALRQLSSALKERILALEQQERLMDSHVLQVFLDETEQRLLKEISQKQHQLRLVQDDKARLQTREEEVSSESGVVPSASPLSLASSQPSPHSSADQPTSGLADLELRSKTASKVLRVHSNFDELMEDYFATKQPFGDESPDGGPGLGQFSRNLGRFTHFTGFRELSSLSYSDQAGGCSIVSAIEFDKDLDFFAVAGVTRKIKVFDYYGVVRNVGFTNHFPVQEMACSAKLSSVCFNPYFKSQLASSDYDGCVVVWDTNTGRRVAMHQEHTKRVWSVHYNPSEPNMFASGSDDCTVKLWYMNRPQSVFSLPARANVCSIKFHPTDRYLLAYGSADHCIHYVDLRKPKEPIYQFKGHRKAVSYVQFVSATEIVSASTDSELKLWSVANGLCLRSFRGHVNEKNFVGLSANPDFIACGSENNAFYVYSKSVSNPMLHYEFNVGRNILPDVSSSNEASQEPNDFVSSVCWKGEDVVLAANSQGHIKVMQME